MSTTPRGRSSHRRGRCTCCAGDRAACCCFNPLRSLFRCPGRRSRSKHRQRTPPSRGRDAPQQQGHEDEPSFFVYAMPNLQGGGGDTEHRKKKKKHRKPCFPSFGSCFRRKKKDRKARAMHTVTDRRPALTPATSLLTHPPGSPVPPEKSQTVTPSMTTQPPSPAPTENNNVVNSPAPPGRHSACRGLPVTPRPGNQPTTNVEGIEIVEVATGERLSTHELGLIEMVAGSSTDSSSAESSLKSSLEYVNEPPPRATKQTVLEREAVVMKARDREPPKLWLNGETMESRARERFTETLRAAEAEELWAHDVACSRVHAAMLAETVSSFDPYS